MFNAKSKTALLAIVTAVAAASGIYLQSVGSIQFWLHQQAGSFRSVYTSLMLGIAAIAPIPTVLLGQRLGAGRFVSILMASAASGLLSAAALLPLIGALWGLAVGWLFSFSRVRLSWSWVFVVLKLAGAGLLGILGVGLARRVFIDGGTWQWGAGVIVALLLAMQIALLLAPMPGSWRSREASPEGNRWFAVACGIVLTLVLLPASWLVGWHSELWRRVAAIEASGGSVRFRDSELVDTLRALYQLRADVMTDLRWGLRYGPRELLWGPPASIVVLSKFTQADLRTIEEMDGYPPVTLVDGALDDRSLAQLPATCQERTVRYLGRAAVREQNPEKAAIILERVLAAQTRLLGLNHPDSHLTMLRLSRLYSVLGRQDAAVSMLEQFVKNARPVKSQYFAFGLRQLATVRMEQARHEEAEALLRECLQHLSGVSWNSYETTSLLGSTLMQQGKLDEAESFLLRAYDSMAARRAQMPALRKHSIAQAAERVVRLYEARGEPEKVAKWRKTLEGDAGNSAD